MRRRRHFANRLAAAMLKAIGSESAAAVLLMVAAAAAMALANSPWSAAYRDALHGPLGWSPAPELATWHGWIGNGLMTVFFFAIGLEIKREAIAGDLSTPARRRLPLLAAAAGMALPAAIYLLLAGGEAALRSGWAIPAATDIAFAVGVLGLVGPRLPPSLRLFLLAVAIADDLGAVAIIALFYTSRIDPAWLVAALALLAVLLVLGRMRVARGWAYAVPAVALWFCLLHSGVHPTIGGVAAALTVPMRLDRRGDSLLLRMEHALAPWVAFGVVPLFGFANAGVGLGLAGAYGALAPLPLAIGAGLVLGKQAGIFGAVFTAEKLGLAMRPPGASWLQLWGLALLCGIGFTMSLFIAALAFPHRPDLVEEAKLGVLAGSLLSAGAGFAILRFAGRSSA